jgi:hypothetical protein
MTGKTVPLSAIILLLFSLADVWGAGEQANLLPNPSFEAGREQPDGWARSTFKAGAWVAGGRGGGKCLRVTGTGEDNEWWRPEPAVSLRPGAVYHTSFWVRRASGGGCAIAGLNEVNRDFSPDSQWVQQGFSFRTPGEEQGEVVIGVTPARKTRTTAEEKPAPFFRLGQWHATGDIEFDDVSLEPAVPVYAEVQGLEAPLGEGESLAAGRYTAHHELGGPGANDHRALVRFTASFNSNRWCFGADSEVVYRHELGGLRLEEPQLSISVNRAEKGRLGVEASVDGEHWVRVGEATKVARADFPLNLPPSREFWVRLVSEGDADIQVDDYTFSCTAPGAASMSAVGATRYLVVSRRTPGLVVTVPGLRYRPAGENQLRVALKSDTLRFEAQVALTVEQEGKVVSQSEATAFLRPGREREVTLSYPVQESGPHTLRLAVRDAESGTTQWEASTSFTVPVLYDARGGELLADTAASSLWWCEPEWKVSRGRPAPTASGEAVRISAAGNEYEAAQVVLTPKQALTRGLLAASDLVADSGAQLPASEVTIRRVDYVFTAQPTDEVGVADEWPDSLPLQRDGVDLAPGRNQPFWVTVHVPAGTPAGDYRGAITVRAAGFEQRLPLLVHVWGFDLPRETHVRSGFGLDVGNIRRYHNLETEAEVRQVHDLYLRDFAAHRISPYSSGRDVGATWEVNAQGEIIPRLDFAGFDEDLRHGLDELGFNATVIDLPGLGGGTFHSRQIGEIEGHQRGTPEHEAAFRRYAQALQDNLRAHGWLDKAYIYWFDEPSENDMDFVKEGMELIGRDAPGLTRLLTTKPNPKLYGDVDLWCMPTYTLDPAQAKERKAAGEELWWYLCTGPKAPYFTLFLDHPGTEIRLWLWETWKYGLDGILVWQTNYWTSGNAYPRPALQDPYEDPMSWTSGYGLAPGQKSPWGNGDGRFLYPPTGDPQRDHAKYLEGPVPSMRWELLRDGLEDYEYFWLLRAEIERAKQAGADPSSYTAAERLLAVPDDVCTSLTQFSITPDPIHAHRAKLAAAIEEMRRR